MAQTVTINKQSYSDVPFVLLNKTDGTGQAKYVDTSDATASSSDLMAGKKSLCERSRNRRNNGNCYF